ncbi:hypothetical protein CC85DRAFT_123206 [Cutaneotrichosporon oleaginosum]|uniref:Uncharacterized protein n=1 Tax=Cutaneotrichosporon oleaginosum TaxID=879819 RepID=A0A0J1B179_9TREE|nr:uncharacterized protein CC85DRAFT_123206 [Cutaneotrichosporon oleaginosum]KLT41349.1 hypothetical protein CC85DRAFT_123206 [Cutaneotrichosporon oleaginosum]TXT06292.1 hypothetical protein COLE_05623 [Cutaneotrichosporon oleaginosum]
MKRGVMARGRRIKIQGVSVATWVVWPCLACAIHTGHSGDRHPSSIIPHPSSIIRNPRRRLALQLSGGQAATARW